METVGKQWGIVARWWQGIVGSVCVVIGVMFAGM